MTKTKAGQSRLPALGLALAAAGLGATQPAEAQIDFDGLNIATTAWGRPGGEGKSNLMEAFQGRIFFVTFSDGTPQPSKVNVYDPGDGQTDGVNHSVLLADADRFNALRAMGGLLWIGHSDGRLFNYDGSQVNELAGTPFSAANSVTAMCEFLGEPYFGTKTGDVYHFDGCTWTEAFSSSNEQVDSMVVWDGKLYGVPHGTGLSKNCLIFSTADGAAWSSMLFAEGVFSVPVLVAAPSILYAGVTDSAFSYSSSVRASSNGTRFPSIHQSGGKFLYKTAFDGIFYDGWSYISFDVIDGVPYSVLIRDGVSTSAVFNDRIVMQMVTLDGHLYTLQLVPTGDFTTPGDVYLMTNAPGACLGDVDGDGTVGIVDFLLLLANWGPCP